MLSLYLNRILWNTYPITNSPKPFPWFRKREIRVHIQIQTCCVSLTNDIHIHTYYQIWWKLDPTPASADRDTQKDRLQNGVWETLCKFCKSFGLGMRAYPEREKRGKGEVLTGLPISREKFTRCNSHPPRK